MGGTRTLIASIGASATLVAAAALSLLALSVVFAFGGWSGPLLHSAEKPALVFAQSTLADGDDGPAAARRAQIVAPAPARARGARRTARPDAADARARPTPGRPRTSGSTGTATSMPSPVAPSVPTPVAPAPPAPAATRKTGDHVRQIGTSLSSTVQKTGTALATATEPLVPPVSAAVQQVLNLVADIVRRTTDGLGGTLDALLPRR